MGILEQILAQKRAELEALAERALPQPPPRRSVALRRGSGQPLRLLAEIKRRSPSAGALSTELSVAERAHSYESAGASMVSVLCDRAFFDGDYVDLESARSTCKLPLLCKEFILDEVQLRAARAFGADAVLLIARCLTPQQLGELFEAAERHALEPLVEVATLREAELALEVGAKLIGVNARDLDSLKMDPERARRILSHLPEEVTRLYLSGIGSVDDLRAISQTGADGALIGEALMRLDDPGPLLEKLVAAAHQNPV